jgi:hypothetical protein
MNLNAREREELERLRLSAARIIMNPLDRAFFDVQKIVDTYPLTSPFRVLAVALIELKRSLNHE